MYTHWFAGALCLQACKFNPLIVKGFLFIVKRNRPSVNLFSNHIVACLRTCRLLYWPIIHRMFIRFWLFWHRVSLFLFYPINIINVDYKKPQKRAERQTFRTHILFFPRLADWKFLSSVYLFSCLYEVNSTYFSNPCWHTGLLHF